MLVPSWTEYVRDDVQAVGLLHLSWGKAQDRGGWRSVIENLLYCIHSLDWSAGDDCMK